MLVMFIYGIAAFGVMLSTKNSMTHAAAEGARSALDVPYTPTDTLDARRITKATTAVAESLGHMGSNYHASDTVASIAGCDSPTDAEKCITVTITYPWSSRPMIPLAPGFGFVMPDEIHASAVVRLS
jgi:Flp pilus assembly protein TadG